MSGVGSSRSMSCSFPRSASADCHEHSDLERPKFIVSQFWRPEDRNQGVGRATFPPGGLGENPPIPRPVSHGSWHFFTCDSITPPLPLSSRGPLSACLLFVTLMTLVIGFKAYLGNAGSSLLEILDYIVKTLFISK